MMFAGQLMIGGWLSATVTNCVAVPVLPHELFAVQVRMITLVVPLGDVSWNTTLVIDPQLLRAVTFGADGGALRSFTVALQLAPLPELAKTCTTMKPTILAGPDPLNWSTTGIVTIAPAPMALNATST